MRRIKFLLITIVCIMVFFIVKVINERSALYPYDTSNSYLYDFNQTNAEIIDLKLENGKIRLAGNEKENKSVFLKVNVQTTLMGQYLQPSIELKAGERFVTQYFEHGAKGTRYINISSLMGEDETEITIKEKYISLNQNLQSVSFINKDIGTLKILVLAPHPDDAEIAAYGLYSDNNQSYVITVTAGDAGKFKYNEIYNNKVAHYLKKGELRTWNSITVPLLGGIPSEHILNLGFFDRMLIRMFNDKSKEVGGYYTDILDINTYRKQNISSLATGLTGTSNWNSLVENLIYLLDKIEPDIIVTPYPALDAHPDHKFTTVALIEAMKASGIRDGDLYLYTNHCVVNEYYPYGRSGGTISLPPHFGDTIYFDSIYSYPLSSDKQKDKLFALEAMHDLRLDTEWHSSKGAIKLAWKQIRRDIFAEQDTYYSYYNRAVRSNELFFVVKIKNIYKKNILEIVNGKL